MYCVSEMRRGTYYSIGGVYPIFPLTYLSHLRPPLWDFGVMGWVGGVFVGERLGTLLFFVLALALALLCGGDGEEEGVREGGGGGEERWGEVGVEE